MPKKVVTNQNSKNKTITSSKNINKTTPVKKTLTRPSKIPSVSPQKKVVSKKPIQPSFNVEKTLVENFVGLQKIMTDLVIKLDGVSNQIIQLLNIFEVSAKTLAEKGGIKQGGVVEKQVLEKIDNLIDQNRTIARGVSLLHNQETPENKTPQPRPQNTQNEDKQYQKSISSKPEPFRLTKRM